MLSAISSHHSQEIEDRKLSALFFLNVKALCHRYQMKVPRPSQYLCWILQGKQSFSLDCWLIVSLYVFSAVS